MAFNPAGAADCGLDTFGGWVSETSPDSLPSGVSPDCPGCSFVPGSVFTRPAFQKVFNPPLAAGTRITYGKSYVAANGTIFNLYLSSNGTLYLENITASPGTASALFHTFGNLYARSVTAFGREFIAISDGFHGQDVPLQFDGTNLDRVTQDGPPTPPTVANTIIPATSIAGFVITNGQAGVTTTSPHGLQAGYQVQITGAGAFPISIASIVLNNTENPGIAIVTTTVAQPGLTPGSSVTIQGVTPASLGSISGSISRQGQVVTVSLGGSQNIIPGTVVTIAGVTDPTFDGTFTVVNTPAPGQFTYIQADVDATSSGGIVSIPWPIPDNTPTPTFFEILSVPTPTTFQVQVTAPDASWGSAIAYLAFDGTYFVKTVVNATQFLYDFQGPNTSVTHTGTVTPFGQVAPGVHLCRQSYLTRQGYLTKPSPWIQFTAPGGQYLTVSNLLIGPPNVVARVLEFTGALGSLFYYLPVPGQVNGQIVSTATQINDNFTTQVLLDFSDNTLFRGLGTSIPGNNTPAQIFLEGALGFASFESYLITWGQRNRVTNFLNLGFDGGTNPFASTTVPGWNGTLPFGSGVVQSPRGAGLGQALKATSSFSISQSAYQDQTGAPILTGNTFYSIRMYLQGGGSVRATISGTGFTTSVTLNSTTAGGFVQGNFATITPTAIPSNMLLTLAITPTTTLIVDEGSMLFTQTPFTDQILNVSYANNPEAFDGVTGETGPGDDPHAVTDFATIADIPYILTRDPGGRLHEISATGTTLPSGWTVNERAANCGALSAFCLTKSQADDNSSSGGEEWFAWASESGARIFGGNQPWKISQEIQPNWNQGFQTTSSSEINRPFAYTIWGMNDPVGRTLYFGLPLGAGVSPTAIYTMSYRELDTAEQIAFSPPYRTSLSGKLIATDNTRKWSPWYLITDGASRMYRSTSSLEPCFLGGATPNLGFFGNVYVLNQNKYTDDDFGPIQSYYTTCSLPSREQEQGLQLGSQRKLLAYLQAYVEAIGTLTITPLIETLTNPWSIVCTRTPGLSPTFDLEWIGANVEAYRMYFRIQANPLAGATDNWFSLSRFVPWFRKSKILSRGASQ